LCKQHRACIISALFYSFFFFPAFWLHARLHEYHIAVGGGAQFRTLFFNADSRRLEIGQTTAAAANFVAVLTD
jgi:hypothetical protein